MDPTYSRPCDDARSILSNDNLTYQRLFATRVTNLLQQRRNIYKQTLLEELTRLRQLLVSATPIAQVCPTHDVSPTEDPREAPFDTSSSTTAVRQTTRSQNRNPDTKHNSSSSVITQDSSSEDNCDILISSNVSFQHSEPQPQQLFSSSLKTKTTTGFPTFSDVVLAHRYINEMTKTYNSTVSPWFSVTHAANQFSATTQHHLDPNTTVSNRHHMVHCIPLEIQSQRRPSLPNSLKARFVDRFSATTFHGRHYVPSLLARLFFQQELDLLFDTQQFHTYSTETASLAKATDLYIQQLLPTHHSASMSPVSSRTSQLESQVTKKTTRTDFHQDHTMKTPSVFPASVLFLPSQVYLPHDMKPFQRRTFYRSMDGTVELRAPAAAWRDDKASVGNSLPSAPTVRSHHAYAVSSEVRGLPSNINLQGVRSGQGIASVTLAFGFQRRTNYPFRRAYGQLRAVGLLSASTSSLPGLSREFASRVPVRGLSNTLLRLFQPKVHRGLFFRKEHDGLSLELEVTRKRTTTLYAINTEGKLVREGTK